MAAELNKPSPKSTSAYAQHGTVTIIVGPHEEPLVSHESYMTKNSEFFKAAMKKEWTEVQTRTIKLPEDDLETITNYLTFTYGGDLPTSKLSEGFLRVGVWDLLAKLYIFGERILGRCIRNTVVDEIVRISHVPDEEGVKRFMPTFVSNMLFNVFSSRLIRLHSNSRLYPIVPDHKMSSS